MMVVEGRVATTSGAKYVPQLCKHWAHKFPVDLDGATGVVTFPDTVLRITGTADAIRLSISGENVEKVEQMKDVVARHLDRFAFREAPLNYEWAAQ